MVSVGTTTTSHDATGSAPPSPGKDGALSVALMG